MDLFTLGYQGLQLECLLDVLTEQGVRTLVDVRQSPLSRKPGFSRAALAAAVESRGIRYVHMPALGSPRALRMAYHADGDWMHFTERFVAYLATQDAPIRELADRIQHEACCLLCFEANPHFCHRSFVADRIQAVSNTGIRVTHLIPQTQM